MARTTKHTLHTCLPYGDPDLGAEVELRITFTCLFGAPAQGPSYYSGGQPADPDEIEFVSCVKMCNGKPSPPNHSFADMEQASLDDMAREYLESDVGFAEAVEVAETDREMEREAAAAARVDAAHERWAAEDWPLEAAT